MNRSRILHSGVRASAARLAACVAIVVLLAACGAGTLIGPADTTPLGEGAGNWVVVLYMSADNDLEAQAIDDLNELEGADLSGSGITVLALVDRIAGHDASNGDWTTTRLYEIIHDPDGVDGEINSLPIAVPGLGIDPSDDGVELDMSDPATLDALLSFVHARYAPNHLALVIWGHGSGYRATSFDDTSGGDALFTAELADAIAGHRLDLIGFDTGFSASLEVAYQLRHHAGIMIGSQDRIPAGGWVYDDLLARFAGSNQTPIDLADAIVESFQSNHDSFSSATISVIDLRLIGAVNLALNAFSDQLHDAVFGSGIRSALRESLFYDVEDFYTTPGDLAIDLRHLAQVVGRDYDLADGPAAALDTAVQSAVVNHWSNPAGNPFASGLSVHYIPLAADGSAVPTHDLAYFRGADVLSPLEFVSDSTWVPTLPAGPGLLHRLFYEVLQ